MQTIPFRFAPVFAMIAALFSTVCLADDAPATVAVPTLVAPVKTEAPAKATTPDAAPALPTTAPSVAAPTATPSNVGGALSAPVATPVSPGLVVTPTIPNPLTSASPMDAAASTDSTDLWSRVRSGFKMTDSDTAAVRAQEKFYASHPQYMQRVIERGRRYLYFIVGEVEKRGMPTEIALLPIVESAFVPKAESNKAASGLWQFIPGTGKRYGLERTWWYDGRHDVMASTYAALDYLQDLYNLFGDWQLALAAYNWGEGGVGRALAKTRAKGLDDGFDSIKKPTETAGYVPKLLAIRNIIANPAAFGISIPSVPNQPYFQPVSTTRHMDIQLAAQFAGTTVEELLQLNPGLIRPVFAYKDDRKLLVPADKADAFTQNMQNYDKPLLSWRPYITKKGESLESIAQQVGMPVAELRDVNKLPPGKARGQTILVPIREGAPVDDRQNLASLIASLGTPAATEDKADTAKSTASDSYKVRKGDTLASIAKHHGMSVEALKRLNGIKSNKVALGTVLKLEADSKPAAKLVKGSKAEKARKASEQTHVVRRGDTLDEIARKYDVSVADIKKWNRPVAKGALKVGYKLQIHSAG